MSIPAVFTPVASAENASAWQNSNDARSRAPRGQKHVEIGMYRDGENNLDGAEAFIIPQAMATSRLDPSVALHVEDTTSLYGPGVMTHTYNIDRGIIADHVMTQPHDMSGRAEMANFVAATLDRAYRDHTKQSWLFLVDHGAGDAGGLFTQEPDGSLQHMSIDTLAGAIADGIAIHAKRYPKDAGRRIDGIVMHECFEATVTIAETLSNVGVRYLAASSETTIAPGIPAEVMHDIADHVDDPKAMSQSVVDRVMLDTSYMQSDRHGNTLRYRPAANFMVLDLAPEKIRRLKAQQIRINKLLVEDAKSVPGFRSAVLGDVDLVQGMERDQPRLATPWRADRPAMEVYLTLARDPRLPVDVRREAYKLAARISDIIIAHRESYNLRGFGADYRDAIGPTVHFPTRVRDIDPDAPAISVTAAAQSYINWQNAVIGALLVNGGPPVARTA